jgi:Fe-S-cluster containining protein
MKSFDIKAFKRKTARKRKVYATFLRGLHKRKVKGVDALALRMNDETFREIDCKTCANCCKTMTPTYTPSDIKRISKHVNMTVAQYKDKYLYKDNKGDWLHYTLPCHFLGKDNLCTIYEIRPLDCRGFPHTHKKGFIDSSTVNIQNISYCPATYRIVEKMFEHIVENKS